MCRTEEYSVTIQSASATVAGSTRHDNHESVPPAAVRACPQQRTLGGCVNSLVVEACLQDHEVAAIDKVDESVFLADASRPCSGQHVTKWLWFANALGGVPQGVVDQSVDAFESGAVGT